MSDFIFGGSKITADGDYRWESYDQPRQRIKKQRHYFANKDPYTLLTKVHIVKAMIYPVVMYGCESWTIKKAEC